MTNAHILITGASSGLGAALAREYASPAIRLTLWGRDAERLEGIAAQCRAAGSTVKTVVQDLRDVHAMEAQLDRCDEDMPVDIAIFNAGLGGVTPGGRVVEDSRRAFEVATVNFTAAVVGATTIAGRMVKRRRGQIVLIGSIVESIPLPMSPTYAGTKAGLKMFAESLRLRVSAHGLSVTLASPGFVDTPMSRTIAAGKPFMITSEKAAAIIRRGIARRRKEFSLPLPYALARKLFLLLPRGIRRAIVLRLPSE
jgi:short-subunit dehydrogenase